MLEGFWGGVIVSVVNQVMVFLVLGGLACSILVVQRLVAAFESRARRAAAPPAAPATPAAPVEPTASPRPAAIAAIMAAVHEYSGAAPGTLRLVGVTRLRTGSAWKTASRLEGMRGSESAGNGMQ
jgi:Na+-transporting methylmalonyl-CoA/oxaloacetate decarboxylase gamma subunit